MTLQADELNNPTATPISASNTITQSHTSTLPNNSSGSSHPIQDFFKENLKAVIGTLLGSIFSVYTFTYIITSTFITYYIEAIGLGAIKNAVVINESTTHSIIWHLTLLVGSLVYMFCLTPFALRIMYSEGKNKYFKFQNNDPNKNKGLISLFLIATMGTFPLMFLILLLLDWDAYRSVLTPLLLTVVIYGCIWKKSEHNAAFYEDPLYYLGSTLIFCLIGSFTFLPFIFLLSKVDYSYFITNIPKIQGVSGDYTVFIVFWIVYAVVYGSRIHLNTLIQYVIDIAIIGFFLILLAIFSPKTLMLPLVEFTGIKDDRPYIYKVSQENFEKNLADEIPEYWEIDFKNPESFCAKSPRLTPCPIMFVNQVKDKAVKNIYLNGMVIYRDEKRVLLCPPTIDMGKMLAKEIEPQIKQTLQSTCIVLPSDVLEPTTLTSTTLSSHRQSLEKNKANPSSL